MFVSALLVLLSPLSIAETGLGDAGTDPVSCRTPASRIATTLPADGQLDVPRTVQPVVVMAPCPVEEERTLSLWAQTTAGLQPITERTIDPDPEGHGRVLALDLPASALAADADYLLEIRDADGQSVFRGFRTSTTEETFTPPAPQLPNISMQLDRERRVRVVAMPQVLAIDGLVALFPAVNLADAEPSGTSLEALYDITPAPTTIADIPAWEPVSIDVAVPVTDATVESCFVARHRTRSGQWSEPSTMRCAVPFDPFADPIDTGLFFDPVPMPGRGCAIAGTSSASPVRTALIAALLVFLGSFCRRRR